MIGYLVTCQLGEGNLAVDYILLQDLVKSRSREIVCYDYCIALKFDRHLGSAAAEGPVKFQSDWKSLNPNLAISRLHEILQ